MFNWLWKILFKKGESDLLNSGLPIKWQVKGGKLLLNGRDQTPLFPMTKSDLEAALQRLQDKIVASGKSIIVEVIYIETHIATGLWDEGSITLADLQSADGRYRGITFSMQLLGQPYLISIQTGTYYVDYEFIVTGIPGVVRVRDLPDLLAVVSGEKSPI